ncbi:MAG TPA: gamma carbonic anhydrase family protein [Acidimicrobiales bacterium]|jgi:carbonic anhydrase/acetyltransferase-like protein (isoleucine patch superfamily)|nr:gamma carbonic anhydrase family protein [Acidimicrobiales bacterium]
MAVYALGDQVPDIHPSAHVAAEAVVIGSVTIGAESSIWPGAVLRGDDATITIGARTSIQDGTVVHTTPMSPTRVGDECVVGHLAHLEGCIIHDGALVGSGSVVLHNAVVETGALVGAQALVPNNMVVPSGAMALGVPAKLRPDSVQPEFMIRLAMESYVARAIRYRAELRRID